MEGTNDAILFLAIVVEIPGGGILDRFGWWFCRLGIGSWDAGRRGMGDVVRFFGEIRWFLGQSISQMQHG